MGLECGARTADHCALGTSVLRRPRPTQGRGRCLGMCANKLLGALMMLQFEDSGLDYFSFFSHQKLHFIACKKEVVLISYVCELLKVWREN